MWRFSVLPQAPGQELSDDGIEVFLDPIHPTESWKEAMDILAYFPLGSEGTLFDEFTDLPYWIGHVIAWRCVSGSFTNPKKPFNQDEFDTKR